jgi:hypothetical protein
MTKYTGELPKIEKFEDTMAFADMIGMRMATRWTLKYQGKLAGEEDKCLRWHFSASSSSGIAITVSDRGSCLNDSVPLEVSDEDFREFCVAPIVDPDEIIIY